MNRFTSLGVLMCLSLVVFAWRKFIVRFEC